MLPFRPGQAQRAHVFWQCLGARASWGRRARCSAAARLGVAAALAAELAHRLCSRGLLIPLPDSSYSNSSLTSASCTMVTSPVLSAPCITPRPSMLESSKLGLDVALAGTCPVSHSPPLHYFNTLKRTGPVLNAEATHHGHDKHASVCMARVSCMRCIWCATAQIFYTADEMQYVPRHLLRRRATDHHSRRPTLRVLQC